MALSSRLRSLGVRAASQIGRPQASSAAVLLGLLVAAVVFFLRSISLVGEAAAAAPVCTGSDHIGGPCKPPPVLTVPDCSAIPGLAEPPELVTPLSLPAADVLRGAKVGALPGAGRVTPAGTYAFRLPVDAQERRGPALVLDVESTHA